MSLWPSYFWRLKGNLFSWLFQLLEAAHISWLMSPFPFQSQQWLVKSFSCFITHIDSPASLFHLYGNHLWLRWAHLDNTCLPPKIISPSQGQLICNLNATCNLNSLFPCNLTHSQVSGDLTYSAHHIIHQPWALLVGVYPGAHQLRVRLPVGHLGLLIVVDQQGKIEITDLTRLINHKFQK